MPICFDCFEHPAFSISRIRHKLPTALMLILLLATIHLATLAANAANASLSLNARRSSSGEYSLNAKGIGSVRTTQNRVQNARSIRVPQSSVQLILWNEQQSDGTLMPFYAISTDGHSIARIQQASYDIMLRYGQFDPSVSRPAVPEILASDNTNQEGVYLVQFVTQPLDEFRAQIQKLGGTIYKFVANNAYLVRMNSTTHDRVANLPYVRWVGDYHPAYRLEEALVAQLAQNKADLPVWRYSIQVFERGLAQQESVAERIRQAGGIVHELNPEGFRFEATLSADQLLEVVKMSEVLFIDRWGPNGTDMDIVREIGGANFVESVAGFAGEGVRGEVMDSGGFRVSHQDFQSRPLVIHGAASSGSHGASTSGIVFGDGAANPLGRGMLPRAQGIVSNGLDGSARYMHTAQLVQPPYNAVFQSNSWGGNLTTAYTTVSSEMDDIIFLNDILITQSQSNNGNQSSRPQAWAKNIVSIGGIRHFNTATMTDDSWSGGASIGPAADGRIKPDLAHFYDSVFTTTNTSDTAYTNFSGTSAATPIVAGHFGIFYQMWHAGIFGNQTGASVFDSRPHMTTAKAMLINTATQWNFSGVTHDLTRTHQGWGRPDLRTMYDLRNRMLIVDQSNVLRNLEQKSYQILVDGTMPLRATLVYPDPPGTTSATQHRINDLTLKLLSPSGDTFYIGNRGLLGAMWSQAGGDPIADLDTKNTVENVFIQNPEPGEWKLIVTAAEVNEDGYRKTRTVDAVYSLVVSGVATRTGS